MYLEHGGLDVRTRNHDFLNCVHDPNAPPGSNTKKDHWPLPTATVLGMPLHHFAAIIYSVILILTFSTKIIHRVMKTDELMGSPVNPISPGSFAEYGAKV